MCAATGSALVVIGVHRHSERRGAPGSGTAGKRCFNISKHASEKKIVVGLGDVCLKNPACDLILYFNLPALSPLPRASYLLCVPPAPPIVSRWRIGGGVGGSLGGGGFGSFRRSVSLL